jgi:hypothetical protein
MEYISRFWVKNLALDDSAHGASAGTSAAAHASVLIDLELAASVLDSANGASTGAGTATDASISDFVCHK